MLEFQILIIMLSRIVDTRGLHIPVHTRAARAYIHIRTHAHSRDYFYIRLEDRRCLYLNPANEHSELLITAEQMATLEDDRFLWFMDEERGLIRSAWGRFGCITHEG